MSIHPFRLSYVLGAVAPLALLIVARHAAVPHYHVTGRITVGRVGDGFVADFITVDSVNRRLYGLGKAIVDVDKDAVADTTPFAADGGYALALDLGKGLVRNGTLFDLKTRQSIGHVDGKADASVYDPGTHRAFMLLDTVTVVDMQKGAIVARQHIAHAFESGVADGHGKLFINREDSSIVTKVDVKSLTIDARYPIDNCKAAQGLSMDRAHRRLFLGCDKQIVVVDADKGAVVARVPVAGHADENAFDAGTGLIFNANSPDSTLTVVHEDSPNTYSVVDVVKTGGAARSVAVDGTTHKVYAFYYDRPSSAGTDYKQFILNAVVLAP